MSKNTKNGDGDSVFGLHRCERIAFLAGVWKLPQIGRPQPQLLSVHSRTSNPPPSPRMTIKFSDFFSKPKQTTHQHTHTNNANTTEVCATTQRHTQASHKCVFHTSGKTKKTMCNMCYVIRITPIAYCTIFRPIVYCLLPTAVCPLHITKDPSAYSPRLTPPNSPKPSSSLPQQHIWE